MKANNGGYKALCPSCGERMRIQAGATDSLLSKPMYGQCLNMACGATFVGKLEFRTMLTPSATGVAPLPLKEVRIPAPAALNQELAL